MTLKSITNGAIPVIAGVAAVGLAIRYFGDKPFIKDIAKGLNGDVVGLFK
jgi:hypothetical protein